MSLSKQHEMHKRRFSRNMGLGLVLAGFVALVFGLTIAKVSDDEFAVPTEEAGS
ncbi:MULTISPECIES: hypothetical protein [unclassified Roseovarius]|uniref:hypothetical protein n=1 Tax=unclassified Roseovarius TaxID=2614913 RepID=UPI00273E96EB|nr:MULTISPECIES: hypothetical protein [unclassified Roseovarius]